MKQESRNEEPRRVAEVTLQRLTWSLLLLPSNAFIVPAAIYQHTLLLSACLGVDLGKIEVGLMAYVRITWPAD